MKFNETIKKYEEIANKINSWNCENIRELINLMNQLEEIEKYADNPIFNNVSIYQYFNIDLDCLPSSSKYDYSHLNGVYAWDNNGNAMAYDNNWYYIPRVRMSRI